LRFLHHCRKPSQSQFSYNFINGPARDAARGNQPALRNFSIEKISGPRVSEQTLVFERATRTLIDQLSQSFVNRGDLPSTRHLHRIYRHRATSHIPRALRHVDGDAVGSLLLNAIAVVASKAH
jgi:hypothetical protein